ncbi:hypothetical protein A4H97_02180 [Niastella yeongjuensis]|uniref:Uncharacterized protein n=1 Tax=Niastella yeongjuensis TaxID=354355 RepID=A0A1V9EX17_9BACT|nr:hypothetical protein A4H97_02180 [Niastella yeongjuensis]
MADTSLFDNLGNTLQNLPRFIKNLSGIYFRYPPNDFLIKTNLHASPKSLAALIYLINLWKNQSLLGKGLNKGLFFF